MAMNHSAKRGSSTSPSATTPGNGDTGFRAAGSSGSGPGRSASVIVKIAIAKAEYHATGRHLGESSRPSGNTRKRKVGTTPVVGSQSQEATHAVHVAPGRPGRTRLAYAVYVCASS